MASDSSNHRKSVTGDVESVVRISGRRRGEGLIEISLIGHPHRYRVRIDPTSTAPRLIELHLLPLTAGAAEIGNAVIRSVPVRRLAAAAARHIKITERGFITVDELEDDEIIRLRPDYEPGKGELGDTHYRYVAHLLTSALEAGESPREYVKQRLNSSIPTVDRWIREAKERGFLPLDWRTNNGSTVE